MAATATPVLRVAGKSSALCRQGEARFIARIVRPGAQKTPKNPLDF